MRGSVSPASQAARAKAGELLLHPVTLGAIGLLLLNDHVLKAAFASWWTGKLSDVAGLIFFPILLQSGWELGAAFFGRFQEHSNRVLLVCVSLTGLIFSLSQVTSWGANAYRYGLGALQALIQGRWHQILAPIPVRHWADPTDLLALPALLVAVWIGWVKTDRGP